MKGSCQPPGTSGPLENGGRKVKVVDVRLMGGGEETKEKGKGEEVVKPD